MRRAVLLGVLIAVAPLLVAALPRLLPVREGGTGVRTVADNAVLIGRGGSLTLVATVIPSCAKLGYDQATRVFVCNETSTTSTSTSTTTAAPTTTTTTL